MNKALIFWLSLKKFCVAISFIALMLGAGFFHVNAQLDPTFGTDGISGIDDVTNRTSLGFFALPDGKLLVVSLRSGSGNSAGPYDLIRLNADGTPDATYGNGGVVQLSIPFLTTFGEYGMRAAARQPDGKIVIAGTDNNDGYVLRFNPDGTPDTSFSNDGFDRPSIHGAGTDRVRTVLIQPDGKIVVGGNTNITADPVFFVRYNSDGTLDSGFGVNGISTPGISNFTTALEMQSTGKLVAIVGNDSGGRIRRFNADGTGDGTFTTNNTTYGALAIQADDKILAASYVDRAESVGRTYRDTVITRFNADGTIDSGFGTGGSLNFNWNRYSIGGVQGITPLSDGRILLSGYAEIAPNRSKYRSRVGGAALLSSAGVVTGTFLMAGFPQMSGGDHVAILPNGKFVFDGLKLNDTLSNGPYKLRFAQITGVPLETYHFKANPYDFVFSMDGVADAVVFRPSDMWWYGLGGFAFGTASDILVPADYIKNFSFKDDFSVEMAYFRPSNGNWYISPNNGNPANTIVAHWGQDGDIPAPADFDGDAKADLAVFRPSSGDWWIRNSGDNSVTALHWGLTGDKPVPGDYDGDGRDDVAVFRPSSGDWFIIKSSGGMWFLHFGATGDIPVQDDYDGDGKADIAVWRPSDRVWYRLNSSDGSFYALQWGLSTDVPVPADYDGDFKTDISVWRASDRAWYILDSATNTMTVRFWGLSTDIPVAGRY